MASETATRFLTAAVTIAVCVGLFVGVRHVLAPHRFVQDADSGTNGLPPGVGVRLERSKFTGYDAQNRPVWILRADVVDAATDKMRVEARGNVEAELLDAPTGKRRAFVVAPGAVFTRASNTLQASGKTVARFPGNDAKKDLRVETQTLLWNIGAKQVLCSGAVQGDLPGGVGTMNGRDASVDLTTREVTIQKFHGAFVLPSGAGTRPPSIPNPFAPTK